MDKEIWKDIPDYEGHYQVSNLGRIRSLDRIITHKNGAKHFKEGQIQKLQDNGNGRLYKQMKRDGTYKNFYVSRLVMLAFVGERPDNYVICHIDGDLENNRLDNLRYDTPYENNIDQFRHRNRKNTVPTETVIKIRRLFDSGKYSNREISNKFNIKLRSIYDITARRTYKWLRDDGSIVESATSVN